jgi:hypothetical protein
MELEPSEEVMQKMADDAMANACPPANKETEEDTVDIEIEELERILASAKKEGAKRMQLDRSRIDGIKQQELARRKRELQDQAFHANTTDFFNVLKGPMHVYRHVGGEQTDCFLVSRSCSSKTGEFVASWENGHLVMHPWNKGMPTQSYPVDTLTNRGAFNIMRPTSHRRIPPAPVWGAPRGAPRGAMPPFPSTNRYRAHNADDATVPVPGLTRSFGGFRRLSTSGAVPVDGPK